MTRPFWRRYLRFWGSNVAADVDDELRFHIESRVAEYVAAGMSPAEARRAAWSRFGNVESVRERCEAIDNKREQGRRRIAMWDALKQDARYALRTLRRNPAFTLIAVVTLSLGIGANSAIFSVVNGVLLRPLPYREPDRLVRLFTAFRGSGEERYAMSQPEFSDYKGLTQVFENAAAFTGTTLTLTGSGEPQRVSGMAATRDLLPVLGITPFRGRNFEGDEGRAGREPVVLLAYEFWQNRFGGDPTVLGRVLTLNGINRRVVGILPRDATFFRAEAFIPIYINPDSMTGRATNYLRGVARLRPGVSVDAAQRELNALTRRIAQQYASTYPESMGYGATVVSMHEVLVGDTKPALLILLGAVALVLLIACANVANLLLVRGEARQREIAMRLALGAGRGRLIRQLITESSILALLGAVSGSVLAWWGMKSLLAINPNAVPRMELIGFDFTVAAATFFLALVTGVLFGLAPALQLVRPVLRSALQEGSRGASVGGAQQRLGRSLVMGEIALAVVVVIGATLLVRSFWALRSSDPGFRADSVLAIDLALPATRYDPAATTVFYRELVRRVGALPGVERVAMVAELPPVAGGNNWDIEIAGRPLAPGQAAPSPQINPVGGEFFATLSIPMMRGRSIGASDREGTAPVAVINETLARRLWPSADPIGQQIRFDTKLPWVTIVGIVRDVHSAGLAEAPRSELYLAHEQMPVVGGGTERTMWVIARTKVDPSSLAAASRALVKEMDPLLAITGIRRLTEIVDESVADRRLTMVLLAVFGSVALTLAAIGIYGIMSYSVRRRTREIGIRIALGGRPRDVVRLVVGQGMRLTLLGVVAGTVAAVLATKLMAKLLFNTSPTDVVTFAAVVLLMAAVAWIASWLPARRAVRTNPTNALRTD
ncbi:MAG TPA: ABC transporter permease [Gemmatimonadaceae bacterium]